MPPDERDAPAGRAALLGFHSYADDTLRLEPDGPPPRRPEAWGDPDPDAWPGEVRPRRRRSGLVVGGALALVAGAAVAFAWKAGPDGRSAPEATEGSRGIQAELAPAPEASEPLRAMALQGGQVAPPSLLPTVPPAPPHLRVADAAPPASELPDPPAPAPAFAHPREPGPILPAPPPPIAAPLPERARVEPAFDCGYARSPAQQMVCNDPELAAADRRMDRAYRAALAAGAPPEDLRLEQQDWMDIREDAARHSRAAVADIYRQRIDDLRQWRADAADRDPER